MIFIAYKYKVAKSQLRISSVQLVAVLASLCIAILCSGSAQAQTMTYVNSTDGAVDETATPCTVTGYLVRNFTVGTSYTVSDVNLGVLIEHTYRGDLFMYLTSPAGTRVQVFTGTGTGADNFNVLMDNASGTNVTTHNANDTATAGTVVPPYQRTFAPANTLNAFNGQNSLGTWRLEVCDRFGGDVGDFYQANLFLSQIPSNYADLSLTKTVSNATPASGTAISYTLSVTNAGASPNTATGVVVRDLLPAGVTFVSATGFGSYNSGTGDWTVGSINPGQTRALTINATVSATSGATVTNVAEVIASSQPDIDSIVNNGATGEDDYATRSFTVTGTRVAGTPPSLTLVCPVTSRTLLDWNSQTWTTNSLTNTVTLAGIGAIGFNITTDNPFVTGSPAINSINTGGLATTETSLFENMNNTSNTQTSTTVMTLPTAVPGLQFTIFDIDFGNTSFSDKITVTGTFNGATVIPTVTNGIANYVIGNTAIGDASSGGTSADGNVVVTFLSPVDTVTIVYGNHTTAPANPGNQYASIHDITFCNPTADFVISKTSTVVDDPFNGTTDPKAIPGATMRYCILVTNNGSGTVTSVVAIDSVPADVTYVANSMRSGDACNSVPTVEDDDNSGPDESDPFGMSISGTTVTGSVASIGPSSAIAMVFDATVN